MSPLQIKGWVELDGRRLTVTEIEQILIHDPAATSRFGGEFYLSWDSCRARDHFGVMQGDCSKGTVLCKG